MPNTLSEAATTAGLTDPDLLKLARTDVSPREAVAELQSKFPGAFRLRHATRDMTRAEFRAGLREITSAEAGRQNKALDDTALARFGRKFKMGT